MTVRIPKRHTTAILQSLGAGVVPRVALEHIAVGRADEITTLLNDLDDVVAEGGATFRLILGRYGSGKSFLCQLIRNYALNRNFVVADADLSPERRFTGSKGQGLALYRELLNNMATRTRPEGNAFSAILERWINDVQSATLQDTGLDAASPEFTAQVEMRIRATINQMEQMVHGFDFGTILSAYWRGYQTGNEDKVRAATRWLRGEYSLKSEARADLGVRVIIDDDTWYDYIKLMAHFVTDIGYGGLIIFFDEAVNLYKISNKVARNNNYERLLSIYNDALQGKAEHLGIIIGGTPQLVEDTTRGLYSYEALRSRLAESRFAGNGLRDLSGPLIRLEALTPTEIYVLLQRVRSIHGMHHAYEPQVTDEQLGAFINEAYSRVGADRLITPREIIRDYVSLLNLLQQNPDATFESILQGSGFELSYAETDPDLLTPATEIHDDDTQSSSPYASFKI